MAPHQKFAVNYILRLHVSAADYTVNSIGETVARKMCKINYERPPRLLSLLHQKRYISNRIESISWCPSDRSQHYHGASQLVTR